MDNPTRHLEAFIREYYYGEVSDETIAADAAALEKYMRERGWEFELIPVEER